MYKSILFIFIMLFVSMTTQTYTYALDIFDTKIREQAGNYEKGSLYFRQKKYLEALSIWKKTGDYKAAAGYRGIADLYKNGMGVEKNLNKALEWYIKSLKNGAHYSVRSISEISKANSPVGVKAAKFLENALAKFTKKNIQCNVTDLFIAGSILYHTGDKVIRTKAAEYFKAATAEGNIHAMDIYAVQLLSGRGVARDKKKAIEIFTRAANAGNVRSMYSLTINLNNKADIERAFKWLERLVDLGEVSAIDTLAFYYRNGRYVRMDKVHALNLYRKAYKYKSLHAIQALAAMYGRGEGVKKNFSMAEKLYEEYLLLSRGNRAVAKSLADLCYNNKSYEKSLKYYKILTKGVLRGSRADVKLGIQYLNGYGVEKKPKKAFLHFKKSKKIAPLAMNYYARMLDEGLGTLKNKKLAQTYFFETARFILNLSRLKPVKNDLLNGLVDYHPQVRQKIHILLKNKGFYHGEMDTKFNKQTYIALVKFMKYCQKRTVGCKSIRKQINIQKLLNRGWLKNP